MRLADTGVQYPRPRDARPLLVLESNQSPIPGPTYMWYYMMYGRRAVISQKLAEDYYLNPRISRFFYHLRDHQVLLPEVNNLPYTQQQPTDIDLLAVPIILHAGETTNETLVHLNDCWLLRYQST